MARFSFVRLSIMSNLVVLLILKAQASVRFNQVPGSEPPWQSALQEVSPNC
jgi:hypothetical protein